MLLLVVAISEDHGGIEANGYTYGSSLRVDTAIYLPDQNA